MILRCGLIPLDRQEASGGGGGEARGSKGRRRKRKRRKVGLITSCIFKQAHSPCGEESSILAGRSGKHVRKRKTRGDRRVGKKRGSWLVKWRLGAAGPMREG